MPVLGLRFLTGNTCMQLLCLIFLWGLALAGFTFWSEKSFLAQILSTLGKPYVNPKRVLGVFWGS